MRRAAAAEAGAAEDVPRARRRLEARIRPQRHRDDELAAAGERAHVGACVERLVRAVEHLRPPGAKAG